MSVLHYLYHAGRAVENNTYNGFPRPFPKPDEVFTSAGHLRPADITIERDFNFAERESSAWLNHYINKDDTGKALLQAAVVPHSLVGILIPSAHRLLGVYYRVVTPQAGITFSIDLLQVLPVPNTFTTVATLFAGVSGAAKGFNDVVTGAGLAAIVNPNHVLALRFPTLPVGGVGNLHIKMSAVLRGYESYALK